MIGALLFVSLAAPGAASGGCAGHWKVEVNADSFANNGAGRTFTAAELDGFRGKVDEHLKAVIGEACRSGAVEVTAAKAVRRVVVSSASGASDPFLYASASGTLNFEWIFAEENLAVPAAKDIVAGTACWTDPNGPACVSGGD